jgi:hypothetical protein
VNILPLVHENGIATDGEWLLHLDGHQGTWPGLRMLLRELADESDSGSARQRGLLKLAGVNAVYMKQEHG